VSEQFLGNGDFGDIDAEDLELPVYARGAPVGIVPIEPDSEDALTPTKTGAAAVAGRDHH